MFTDIEVLHLVKTIARLSATMSEAESQLAAKDARIAELEVMLAGRNGNHAERQPDRQPVG